MPWTATFKRDTDSPEIGTLTAVYTAEDGAQFHYSKRIKNIDDQQRDFVAEAKARAEEWQRKREYEAQDASVVLSALNA